jgi:pimeloyl-ACP methyl ester carboxylesterase
VKTGLYYEVHEGDGPFLLLVHGMLASRAQWLPNLEALARFSRPVVVELLGHGRSPAPDDARLYAPSQYTTAFEQIRWDLGAERWAILGQSLGAALTLRYALDHPQRVLAQIFTNSTSALAEPGWGDAVRPAMQALAGRLETEGTSALRELPIHPAYGKRLPELVRRALVEDCDRADPRGIGLTGVYTVPESPVRDRIAQNRVPTLLVCGKRERRFEPHRKFAEAHAPGLDVVEIDAGHAVNAEAASAFNAAVRSFLEKHAAL